MQEMLSYHTKCHLHSMEKKISNYDGDILFASWLQFVRMQEEFINIFYELHGEELIKVRDAEIGSFFLCSGSFKEAKQIVIDVFGEDVGRRFSNYVSMFSRQNFILSFAGQNFLNLSTVGDLLNYSQTRRLYYVTILRMIPLYAKGDKKIRTSEIPTEFSAYIDFGLLCVTTGVQNIIQSKCLKDFYGVVTNMGIVFRNSYTHLEDLFMEPLRLSTLDVLEFDKDVKHYMPPLPKRTNLLYSMEELDYTLPQHASIFSDYHLDNQPVFKKLSMLVEAVKPFFVDGYYIKISEQDFTEMSKQTELELYKEQTDYFDLLNTRNGFVKHGAYFYSTFFLFDRFVVNSLYESLRKNRRYQIKSGFYFETKVTEKLNYYGFKRLEGVKRINQRSLM